MPLKMDGTSGQTMDQLGLGGIDANTMDWIDQHIGNSVQRISTKSKEAVSSHDTGRISTKGILNLE